MILQSALSCPACGVAKLETMPTDACQYFYECTACRKPTTAHWGIPDPATVEGTDMQKKAAFAQAFKLTSTRINLFLSLPLSSIDLLRIKAEMDAIGKIPIDPAS